MKITYTQGYKIIEAWLAAQGNQPFLFQQQTWQHIIDKKSGLVNAPTGCGKTYSVFLGAVIDFINSHPTSYQSKNNNGLQLLWLTPLRALAKDIARAMEEVLGALHLQWKVGIRNGDTPISERQKQKKQMPEVLIITPESLHLLLAQNNNAGLFKPLKIIAVDEWHELMGSKRGVQVELAIARIVHSLAVPSEAKKAANKKGNAVPLQTLTSTCSIWGISATIGNLQTAMEVLLSPLQQKGVLVKAGIKKNIDVIAVIPDEVETYPWAGHLGIKLVQHVVNIILQHNTTLVFINTRGMSEMWYQAILSCAPELSGAIALHHGSMQQELRLWVEDSLHSGKLKAVVCTASLDLGVDFRPVDTVVQVGSPKGVSRFLQRAGRSGHQPGQTSRIFFLPAHTLELVEVAALKAAIHANDIESKEPLLLCFDVLIQYVCTLAVGDGFDAEKTFKEIKSTYCYAHMSENEWQELLFFLYKGGKALQQYDDYKKLEWIDGLYIISNRKLAMRHRMHIGTIVSDAMLKVKFVSGGYIGMIEEWFVSRLETGDVFTLAGRKLEFVMLKDMTVLVKNSNAKKSIVPSWMGGRMSLTANLGQRLRKVMQTATAKAKTPAVADAVLTALAPIFTLQKQLSIIPKQNQLLIEHIETKDGFHLFVYPFEGRLVHEAMAAILAYRISKLIPITFSIAMNDYGFELLSDQPVPLNYNNTAELFSLQHLLADMQKSVNATEMARRKFRDIAVIGGLIFQGLPGEKVKARHLQSSASLLFNVFASYDPNNILLQQAYKEVFDQQMEEQRLRNALERINNGKIIITHPSRPTPFCFPILVDGLSRNNLSSEKLEDRIKRMQAQLKK